jgi:hypothetical protein
MWGYGRAVLDNTWNENKNIVIPANVKAEMTDYFSRMTGNGFRMSVLLQLEALNNDALSPTEVTFITNWLKDTMLNGQIRGGGVRSMHEHFAKYASAANLLEDEVLLDALRTKLGITSRW